MAHRDGRGTAGRGIAARMALAALGCVALWGLWGLGRLRDAPGAMPPQAEDAGAPGALGAGDLASLARLAEGNALAGREVAGRPVEVDAEVALVSEDGDAIVVRLTAEGPGRFDDLVRLSCRFPASAGTAPLSGWMVGQPVAVRAVMGARQGDLEGCRLWAYAGPDGRPAGRGEVRRDAWERPQRAGPGQVYPRAGGAG